MTTNYFKVDNSAFFFFDEANEKSTKEAFDRAFAHRTKLKQTVKDRSCAIAVWKPAKFKGPWQAATEIGIRQ
jgi:hypothetical protein